MTVTVPEVAEPLNRRERPSPRPRRAAHDAGGAVQPAETAAPPVDVAEAPAGPEPAGASPSPADTAAAAWVLLRCGQVGAAALLLDAAAGVTLAVVPGDAPAQATLGVIYVGVLAGGSVLSAVLHRAHLLRPPLPADTPRPLDPLRVLALLLAVRLAVPVGTIADPALDPDDARECAP